MKALNPAPKRSLVPEFVFVFGLTGFMALLIYSAFTPSTSQARPAPAMAPVFTSEMPSVDAGKPPVLSLQAQASEEVMLDTMVVNLAVEAQGNYAGKLNAQVLAQLNAILAKAKQPGIDAKLGSLGTSQVWGPNRTTNGWRVRGVVVLESQDFTKLGELSGDLSEMAQLAGVQFILSNDKRREVQKGLIDRVSHEFTEKADQTAKALGFYGHIVQNVSLNESGGQRNYYPQPMMMAKGAMADPAVPSEGGKTEVSVSMSGTVSLTK